MAKKAHAIVSKEYRESTEKLMTDPIIIKMAKEVPAKTDMDSWKFMKGAYDEYLHRGGDVNKLKGIGTPAEAIKKIKQGKAKSKAATSKRIKAAPPKGHKPGKITPQERKLLNKLLHEYAPTQYHSSSDYYDHLPLKEIDHALKELGFILVDDDGTALSAIFTGAEGEASMNFARSKDFEIREGVKMYTTVIDNARIIMQWHRMPSGKYEINLYCS